MYIDDNLEVFGFLADSLEVVGFLAGALDFVRFLFPPLESFAAFEFDLTENRKL